LIEQLHSFCKRTLLIACGIEKVGEAVENFVMQVAAFLGTVHTGRKIGKIKENGITAVGWDTADGLTGACEANSTGTYVIIHMVDGKGSCAGIKKTQLKTFCGSAGKGGGDTGGFGVKVHCLFYQRKHLGFREIGWLFRHEELLRNVKIQ
jgi:hypothetical protein